jgi:hypothetical protein
MALNFHEDLKRAETVHGSSDRTFGLVFAAFFLLVGISPLRKAGHVRDWALVLSGIFLAIAVARPRLLHFLNILWAKLGLLLGRIANPIVTTVLFFLIFAPAGVLLRLLGKDPLRLKPHPQKSSYWIARHPPGPMPESMSRQF